MKIYFSILLALLVSFTVSAQELVKNLDVVHSGAVRSLAINNKSSIVITGGDDNRGNTWDVKDGKKIKVITFKDAATALAFNSSNKILVGGGMAKRLIVFDVVPNGNGYDYKVKRMFTGHDAGVTAIAFNPLSNIVCSVDDNGVVKLWDASTAKLSGTGKGHTKRVNAVSFSPDGEVVATGSDDNTVRIFSGTTGQVKKTIEVGQKVTAVAFSADGAWLASATRNGIINIWDPQTGSKLMEFSNGKDAVNSITFSPDVQYLLAGGDDNHLVVWDMATQQVKNAIPAHDDGITVVQMSQKGDLIVTAGGDGSLMFWETDDMKIGKKKIMASGGDAPKLVCSPLQIKDDNNNGILEVSEKPHIKFKIENKGKGQAYDIVVRAVVENRIKGLSVEKEINIGNLQEFGEQEVSIPVSLDETLESMAGTFVVTIKEGNGHDPTPLRVNFQTRGVEQYSYIMVMSHAFSSATGKADIGAPITMKLTLKNTSKGVANNVKVNYLFPEKVLAVDKLSETIEELGPGDEKEVSVQFYADKGYEAPKIAVGLNLEGVAFTNASDLVLALRVNETLPGAVSFSAEEIDETTAAVEAATETLYRGGGDPLKGLNVSTRAKEMTIGNYYALIIGIDKYSGTWTPLQNAVSDAKAVEALLRSKYKFDQFRTLYNEQATRTKIIAELEYLIANAKPNDNVFIYYSGHGEFKKEMNRGYWVPVDAKTNSTSNYISNSDLQDFIKAIPSKHTLLVSDACFSGDIFRGNTVSVPFEESEKYYKEVHNLASRQAITSGGIEPVMDGGKDGHSVFAYYFLRTLRSNGNKYFDAGQLYTKLKIPVINNSEQTPKISPIKKTGDEGGQFIFIRR
jgi:hypothetical protein